ncbi:1-deoxy-D-xylulose-5-phosphate reductoisomerase [Floricoccus penangensis]|uniref:1-deoxy-D-xylulose 5-phosphate reductoisomerase n=1 Tax=Floricoccus penangensis TaxID=1859475 RepID=A0A9Q5JGP5_9LACT|nr:1-deoxy-D-xylulose-5-phosphate reductoisomerase [Floricoccus penangensis]OFI47005.1 1-deoxy-D-xylulose-5-phosphate reductoisomerase [Floricoccus penangensis]
MKKICLLGATGSIGTSTLDVIKNNSDKFQLVAMSFGKNIEKAQKIIEDFSPKYVSVQTEELAETLKNKYPQIDVFHGNEGLNQLVQTDYDLLLNAVMGSVGLIPTMTAIELGRDIAIANKETLVVAGDFIMPAAKKAGVNLLPVDSEHSAIFQVLQGVKETDLRDITITASGGSFRDKKRSELVGVSVKDALNHPNWSMGAKITIDSATMVNKGLEVIEAHHLFQVDYDDINVIMHRESVVHSLITLKDGAMYAELGASDMRQPIQFALTYPDHISLVNEKEFSLAKLATIHFEEVNYERFPMLALAFKVGRLGGSFPAVFNAANEVAVAAFLQEKIEFLDIEKIIEKAVDNHVEVNDLSLEKLISIDSETRNKVENWISDKNF